METANSAPDEHGLEQIVHLSRSHSYHQVQHDLHADFDSDNELPSRSTLSPKH